MGRKSEQDRLQATAFHEAGHAVAALYNLMRVSSVTIVPDAHGGDLGHIIARHRRQKAVRRGEAHLEEFIQYASYILAGPQAEKRHTGRQNNIGASGDYRSISELALRYGGDSDQARLLVRIAAMRTRNILAEHWERVEAVAAALMERQTITGEELGQLIRSGA